MRSITGFTLLAVLALATPALANMGGSSTPEPKQPSGSAEPGSSMVQAHRAAGRARLWRRVQRDREGEEGRGREEGQERGEALPKALERAQKAVENDTAYHEAWNLVGYASRKLGKHDEAVAAYQKCLGCASTTRRRGSISARPISR